ncbi:MAG: chordopoxvirus fusion protein, partial [Caldilineae bacterium]
RLEGIFEDIFPLLITHMTTSSDVEAYAREQGLAVYYSYDF